MYILHPLCIGLVMVVLPGETGVAAIAAIAVIVPVTIAAAALSHRYIESPFLEVKSRLQGRRDESPARGADDSIPNAPLNLSLRKTATGERL